MRGNRVVERVVRVRVEEWCVFCVKEWKSGACCACKSGGVERGDRVVERVVRVRVMEWSAVIVW